MWFNFNLIPNLITFKHNQTSFNSRIFTILAAVLFITIYLLKLRLSFQDSVYAFNHCIQNILFGFLYISVFTLMIIWLTYSKTPCVYELIAWDLPEGESLFMCVDHFTEISGLAIFAMFGIIFSYHILLGFLFLYKLHKVLRSINQHTTELEEIIIKNTIMYISTMASTLFFYILWFMDIFHVNFIVHFDSLFNCFMIALMYGYNERYYQCLCGVCARFCKRISRRDPKMLSKVHSGSMASKTNTNTPPYPQQTPTNPIPINIITNTPPVTRITTPTESLAPERSICGFIITENYDEKVDDVQAIDEKQ